MPLLRAITLLIRCTEISSPLTFAAIWLALLLTSAWPHEHTATAMQSSAGKEMSRAVTGAAGSACHQACLAPRHERHDQEPAEQHHPLGGLGHRRDREVKPAAQRPAGLPQRRHRTQ